MRRYEMRDLAAAPRFANPDLGLANPAAVSPRPAVCDLTILDTPDRRLLRAGIVLAHRAMDGEGEWLLAAPGWRPQLPAEYVEAMTSGEVPDSMLALLSPLLRHAPLAPAGTRHRVRSTYLVRNLDRESLGTVIDDHVTIRRDGQVLTQYREVTIDTGTMTREQIAWADDVIRGVDGVQVDRQVPLPTRLRILADPDRAGEADTLGVGPVEPAPADATMVDIVGRFIAEQARDVLKADLNIRSGRTRKVQPLVRALRSFANDLPVVAPVLAPETLDDLLAEVRWAADELDGTFGDDQQVILTGDRYLGIFDRVAQLRRPPTAEGLGHGAAREEIAGMVVVATEEMLRVGRAAPHSADDSGWREAARAAERLRAVAEIAVLLAPKQAKRLRSRANDLLDGLTACDNDELVELRASLAGTSAEEAFGIGRRYAALADNRADARAEYVDHWAKDARKLRAAGTDLLERLGVGIALTEPIAEAGARRAGDEDGHV